MRLTPLECTSDSADVTVLLCPLCAASVRLVPGADANAVWAAHAADSRECIPSAYAQRTTKARCPVGACREKLVFSNTVRCRSCGTATCLRHRYTGDHDCRTPQQQQPRPAAAAAVARQAAPKAPPVFPSLASLKAKTAGQFAEPGNSLAGTAQRRAAAAAPPAMHSGGGSAGREVCPACGWRCDDVVKLVEHHAAVHEARAQSACQVC